MRMNGKAEIAEPRLKPGIRDHSGQLALFMIAPAILYIAALIGFSFVTASGQGNDV